MKTFIECPCGVKRTEPVVTLVWVPRRRRRIDCESPRKIKETWYECPRTRWKKKPAMIALANISSHGKSSDSLKTSTNFPPPGDLWETAAVIAKVLILNNTKLINRFVCIPIVPGFELCGCSWTSGVRAVGFSIRVGVCVHREPKIRCTFSQVCVGGEKPFSVRHFDSSLVRLGTFIRAGSIAAAHSLPFIWRLPLGVRVFIKKGLVLWRHKNTTSSWILLTALNRSRADKS